MIEKSRTSNSIKNFSISIIVQLFNKIMSFIVRTVFIKILNKEYLGVNGLFTNILSILSFAELGIGTAIVFNMYQPIARNDNEKIKSLMQLYKKCYNVIGFVIFGVGMCIIPFLKYLIKDIPNIKENIILIYFLFLIKTSLSYFFSYKKSIISAHQQERVISTTNSIIFVLTAICEIFFLIKTRNYIAYLIVSIVFSLVENIIIYYKADKMFPYLKEKNVLALEQSEKKTIFSNVKSLVIYKLGVTILNSTDNIIISAIISIPVVGLCSNYTLIIESIRTLLNNAFNGIVASVGNLNVEADVNKKESVLFQLTFINFWIYSFCTIAFIILLNPFINIWLGESFVLPMIVSVSLSLNFWIIGMRNSAYTYRITLGLFEKGKITPIVASIINIVLSIVLGKIIGLSGIFFATSISQICSYCWIDPYIVYKYNLKIPFYTYWKKIFKYTILFFMTCIIVILLSNQVNIGVFGDLIIKSCIVIIVPNIIFWIILHNSEEYKNIKVKLFSLIRLSSNTAISQ